MKKLFKITFYALIALLVVALVSIAALIWYIKIPVPEITKAELDTPHNLIKTDTLSQFGPCWLRKQEEGIWQLYLTGQGYQLGHANGILTQELNREQEVFFVNEIGNKVPSKVYQYLLKLFVGWFNKDLGNAIPLEYQKEIYGVSRFASAEFDYIAPAYQRSLNYHAAHDIGHALQNMHLVACTAVGVWGKYTSDSSMYVGRNFDFYVGDDFAKNKIIAFVKPTSGHAFMSVTWAGMIGVLSGMNAKGLTITLNADKSEVPKHTGTPVSIIARDILQYAATIQEAYDIAQKYQSFVSESFMVASAIDRKIAIIEKTPDTTSIYFPEDTRVICTNHFQSAALKNSEPNRENIDDSTSSYRQKRVEQLLHANAKHDQTTLATLLRDQNGKNDKPIGMGNPKAINQLIAHHSIIFNPYKKEVWVSTSPYQLGKYKYYNLDSIFSTPHYLPTSEKDIPADKFLYTADYQNFKKYKSLSQDLTRLSQMLYPTKVWSEKERADFQALNPEYFYTYEQLGDYSKTYQDKTVSLKYYQTALSKDMPSETDRKRLLDKVKKLQ